MGVNESTGLGANYTLVVGTSVLKWVSCSVGWSLPSASTSLPMEAAGRFCQFLHLREHSNLKMDLGNPLNIPPPPPPPNGDQSVFPTSKFKSPHQSGILHSRIFIREWLESANWYVLKQAGKTYPRPLCPKTFYSVCTNHANNIELPCPGFSIIQAVIDTQQSPLGPNRECESGLWICVNFENYSTKKSVENM